MGRIALKEGDYRVLLVTRKDGSTYLAYFRCLYEEDTVGHVVFIDDTGARVGMVPSRTQNMRPLLANEAHPEIDLDKWRDTYMRNL
jgi:hypothetical protein